ncbi:BrnT family toxin [Synechococcus moorigangaii CMS01]|nr:BrnT family toxin [Synechococcus moorigangaii CMS01]
MDFEYDPNKSQSNLAKYGIDFEAAKEIWQDQQRVTLLSDFVAESRWLAIGKIDHKIWTAIYTMRNNRIRLISVRRARIDEVNFYES